MIVAAAIAGVAWAELALRGGLARFALALALTAAAAWRSAR